MSEPTDRPRRARGEPVRPAPHHRRPVRRLGRAADHPRAHRQSEAEIDKAAGININLYAGLGMLVVRRCIFLLWAFTRPLGRGAREAEPASSERASSAAARRGRRRGRPPGRRDPGGQQREHRAAEAAADHPGAGGSGGLQALDGRLDLGHGRLVVVAQRGVRGVEQRGRPRSRSWASSACGRRVDARVLGEHVAGALAQRRRRARSRSLARRAARRCRAASHAARHSARRWL